MFKYESMVTTENAENEITFTNAQYLKQCDVIADGAADELARDLWERVRDEFSEYVDKLCDLSNIDCEMARREQRAKVNKLRRHLEAYAIAFEVMGCELEVIEDEAYSERYPKRIIWGVKCHRDNHSIGYVRMN
jgi:hypothetical protein